MKELDVIIIGAGAAGLAAANYFEESGISYEIFEARNRVGGRIYTTLEMGYPIELGAEFVHGAKTESAKILKNEKDEPQSVPEYFWQFENGELKERPQFWERMHEVIVSLDRETSKDKSFKDLLPLLREKGFTESEIEKAIHFIEGFHASEIEKISVFSLVDMEKEDDSHSESFRAKNGYAKLVEGLQKKIPKSKIHFQSVLEKVVWTEGKVEVRIRNANQESLFPEAKKILITVPLGVLKNVNLSEGAIEFHPEITKIRPLLSKMEMGEVIRMTFCFRSRIWEEKKLGKRPKDLPINFIISDETPFSVWWSSLPFEYPSIIGWSGGGPTKKFLHSSKEELTEAGLNSLSKILGIDLSVLKNELVQSFYHDWHHDPFSRGAYSYVGVGGMDVNKEIEKGVSDTIYFAGESYISGVESGTVNAALLSGKKMAEKMVKSL